MTISPPGSNQITLTFNSFDIEAPSSSTNCNWDYLEIFDGPNLTSPSLGQYCNALTGSPGTITSSGGSITILLHSDQSVNGSGFEADWTCTYPTSPPVTSFNFSDSVSCNSTIFFNDLSTNGPISWLWDFGDGSFSTLQNPVHTYQTSGFFNVKLITSNSFGSDSLIINNAIYVIDVNLQSQNDTACGSSSLNLIVNSSSGNVVWFDDFNLTNIVGTGNVLSTPVINSTTAFYAQSIYDFSPVIGGPLDNSIGEYINSNVYFGGGGSGAGTSNLLGGYGGGGSYTSNLNNLNGLNNTGGGGAGSIYNNYAGKGGSGVVIIKLKELDEEYDFKVMYSNIEILNRSNKINLENSEKYFNITSHLDYLEFDGMTVEIFKYGEIKSSFLYNPNNLSETFNTGIYDEDISHYWNRVTIYENNIKGRFLWSKPSDIEEVIAYVWGGGGGCTTNLEGYNIRGGNGGFVKAKINIKDINNLNIIVGQAGGKAITRGGWPGGGDASGVNGCGGGLSGIFLEDDLLKLVLKVDGHNETSLPPNKRNRRVSE